MNIWAKFVFEPGWPVMRSVISALCALPDGLRPIRHSLGEDEVGMPIDDVQSFLDSIEDAPVAPFLRGGPGVAYDLSGGPESMPVECPCFLNVEPALAKTLVVHMAKAGPLFGYACAEKELFHRNRVFAKLDFGTSESWVGRDLSKYLPGLYWMTVVSETLAEQHGVPLSKVGDDAIEHVTFDGGRHLFQFYERPDHWREHRRTMDALCSSLPGVFSIGVLPPKVAGPLSYQELRKILDPWP